MDELRAVEEAVAGHPDVLAVAAVAVDGGVTAGVVPVSFASVTAIRDHAWQLLGDARAPRAVVLLPALPSDAAGEVDRVELRRLLVEDDPPVSVYAPPTTELEVAVAGVFREVLGVVRVGLDDDFLELGGDSLSAVEVADRLAERVGLTVTMEDIFEAATVRTLLRDRPG